ncbi:MAG: 2-keto-4-methylthiobutyrate aminotransferase [Micavibrio sp.]|nr:MAG: 2-keto-4-methylthiobutyrate aminotransferase [Micavibrio sp.]
MTIWHNQRFKDDNTPIFSSTDRVRLGDGVFDTMLAINGEIIHPSLHFKKILRHANVIGIDITNDIEDMIIAAKDLLKESHLEEGHVIINVIVSRGPAEHGLAIPDLADTQIAMRAFAAPNPMPVPKNVVFARNVCRNEGSPLSQIKNFNYGDNIMALQEARDKDADDALLLNNAGHVACATSSTIAIIKGSRIYTPPLSDGAQEGVTRGLLMERYDVTEKHLSEDDIQYAHALYLINSIRGAVNIETLEGQKYPIADLEIDKDFHLT